MVRFPLRQPGWPELDIFCFGGLEFFFAEMRLRGLQLSRCRSPTENRGNNISMDIVSVLGQEKEYTVKYNPLSEGVPEGKARGNS